MEKRNLWLSRGLNLEYFKPKYFNYWVAAKYKICVKEHKCELCKIPRQNSEIATFTNNQRYDACAHSEENCQYIGKKYCITCAIKKGKCANCQELHPKCTTNGNFFLIINYYMLINLLNYCARCLLSIQPDFVTQKCEIEKFITNSTNGKYHLVMYYSKYHYELNHIKYFWCNAKKYAWKNCNYSLDNFYWCVSWALANIPN